MSTTEVLALLQDARSICLDRSLSSADAKKVGLAIQLTLRLAEEKADKFAQAPADGAVPDFSTWLDTDKGHFPYMENQFTFNELDPFNFMSGGASTDTDTFWGSAALVQDFNGSV